MKQVFTVCILLLSLYGSAQGGQFEVTQSVGFLRVQIEDYPEKERRPILDYLDKSRLAADEAVTRLVTGRIDEFISDIAETTISVEEASKFIRDIYGMVTASEYRGQSLETDGDVHNLSKAFAVTFYAIRSTRRPNEGLYLIVKTKPVGNEHRVFNAQFAEYIGDVPPCLLPQQKR